MAAPLALATRIGVNLEDQMLAVRAATRSTVEEYEHLTDVVNELAGRKPFTPTEVAGTALTLGRAGFDPAEIEASLEPVMDLARATGTDLVEATGIAADAMRAMQLPATEMIRVVDVLTTAANGSSQTLTDLGESMKFMAPIGQKANQSIESVATAAAVLATLGLKGSIAGTGYRRMLASFAEPETLKTIRSFGVEIEHIVDGAREVRPMVDVMVDLGKATQNLSSLERLALFRELFDLRAMGAALSLTEANGDAFVTLLKRMKDTSNAAKEAAAIQESKLGGAFRLLKSAAEKVGVAITKAYGKSLKAAVDNITEVGIGIAEWIGKNQELVTTYAKVTGALIVAGAAILTFGLAIKASAALIGLLAAGPLGLLTIGIGALAVAYANATVEGISFGQSVLDLTRKITGLSNARTLLSDAEQRARQQRMKEGGAARDVRERKGPEFIGTKEDSAAQKASLAAIDKRASAAEKKLARLNEIKRKWDALTIFDLPTRVKLATEAIDIIGDGPLSESNYETLLRGLTDAESRVNQLEQRRADVLRSIGEGQVAEEGRSAEELVKTSPEVIFQNILNQAKRIGERVGARFAEGWRKAVKAMVTMGAELQRVQAEGIIDPEERQLALVELDFAKRRREAKERGESTVGLESIEQQTIANIKARFAREEAAKRMMLEKETANDIARLRILTTKKGIEKERALLALRHKQEVEDAKKAGVGGEALEEKHVLQEKLLEMGQVGQVQAPSPTRGTFSAAAARLLGLGGGGNAADRTAKATEKTAEELGEIKGVLKDGEGLVWV